MFPDSRVALSSDDECVPLTFYFPSNSDGEESELSVGSLHVELQPLTSTTSLSSNQTLENLDDNDLSTCQKSDKLFEIREDKNTEENIQEKGKLNIEVEKNSTSLSSDSKINLANRQEWAFTLYDFDGRHRITKEDLTIMMNTLYETLKSKAYISGDHKQSFQLKFSLVPNSSSSNDSSNHSPVVHQVTSLHQPKCVTDAVTKDKPSSEIKSKSEKIIIKETHQDNSNKVKDHLNDFGASPQKQRSSRSRHFERRSKRLPEHFPNKSANTEAPGGPPSNSRKLADEKCELHSKQQQQLDKQALNIRQQAAEKRSEEIVRRRQEKHRHRKSLAMVNVIDWLQKEQRISLSDQEENKDIQEENCAAEVKNASMDNTEQSRRIIVHEHRHVHEHHHHYYYHHYYGT